MDLISKIFKANKKRKKKNDNLDRRFIKLSEEIGEACQAYFSVTSKSNTKNKSWDDVRKELSDVILIAMDILLTPMPDEDASMDFDILKDRIESDLLEKMAAKWSSEETQDISTKKD